MSKSFLLKLERKDLPNEGLRILSDIIGINKIKVLLVKMPGTVVYIPKYFHKQIDETYLGKNFKKPIDELALMLGVSERTVYRRLKNIKSASV